MVRTAIPGRVRLLVVAGILAIRFTNATAQEIISDDPVDKSGPPTNQIVRDLVGKRFVYYFSGKRPGTSGDTSSGAWTVKHGELRKLVILQRFADTKKGPPGTRTDEVQALLSLAGPEETIRGILSFLYMQVNDQWRQVYIGARDGDEFHEFTFERIRTRDNTLIAEMHPLYVENGGSRYTPNVSAPFPAGKGSAVIQVK